MLERFENSWRTLNTRKIYDNAWIRVREDDVLRPDGEAGIYGVVSMKNRAIGILPLQVSPVAKCVLKRSSFSTVIEDSQILGPGCRVRRGEQVGVFGLQ